MYFSSDNILVGGLSGEKLIAAKFSKKIIPAHCSMKKANPPDAIV